MPAPLPLGSELWQLFYENAGPSYVPRLLGKITGFERDRGYYVRGHGWCQPGYPYFGSKAEAETWTREHPPVMPTIK